MGGHRCRRPHRRSIGRRCQGSKRTARPVLGGLLRRPAAVGACCIRAGCRTGKPRVHLPCQPSLKAITCCKRQYALPDRPILDETAACWGHSLTPLAQGEVERELRELERREAADGRGKSTPQTAPAGGMRQSVSSAGGCLPCGETRKVPRVCSARG